MLTEAKEVIVRQRRFMDLMIRQEEGLVPIDATARDALVGLMARILVVVFHATGRSDDDRAALQSQDHAGAPGRKAIVYADQ